MVVYFFQVFSTQPELAFSCLLSCENCSQFASLGALLALVFVVFVVGE